MGHFIFFAAIQGLNDPAPLAGVDKTTPWRAWRLAQCDLVLVEWLQRPNRNNPPPHNALAFPPRPDFGRRPAGVAFPGGFGDAAPEADALYARLEAARQASAFSKVALHTALMLNRLTDRPVLSVASDDDEWDLAREVRSGRIARLSLNVDESDFAIQDDAPATSRAAPAGARQLHRIAQAATLDWCQHLSPLFGFDGDVGKIPLQEIARVAHTPELPAPGSRRAREEAPPPPPKPRWKFW